MEEEMSRQFTELIGDLLKIGVDIDEKIVRMDDPKKRGYEKIENFSEKINEFLVINNFLKKRLSDIETIAWEFNITNVKNSFKEMFESIKNLKESDSDGGSEIIPPFHRSKIRMSLNKCAMSLNSINFIHINKEMLLREKIYNKIHEFDEVKNILKEKRLLNDEWGPATLLLQSIEMVVNKKLAEKN